MKRLYAIILGTLAFAAVPAVAVRAASAADAQADKDWQAYANVWDAMRAGPPKSASHLQFAQFFEAKNLELRTVGLEFIEEHPADPRRWIVVDRFLRITPRFVKEWGPRDAEGNPTEPVIDGAAAAAWKAKVGELKTVMAKASDIPEELKQEWAKQAEAMEKMKAQQKAFLAKWSGGVTAAPDFAAIDPGGREVRLSEFRGKVVVLDFWATWCGPCQASMPHTQDVAAHYNDQGVVVFANCTSDDRAKFEKWVKDNKSKYPDIIFSYDPAGRKPERVSHRLYDVAGIPLQFVIGRDGKVAATVTGYLKGEVILEGALAKAGITVDPAIIAKAEQDLKNR